MNRRLLSSAFLIFSLTTPLAAQIETLEQFKTKIKGVYYNPLRDGMKGFNCRVKSALMEKVMPKGLEGDLIKGLLKLDLGAAYDKDGIRLYPVKFDPPDVSPKDPDIAQWFEILNSMRDIVGAELQAWAIFGMTRGFNEDKDKIRNVRFKRTGEGYEVSAEDSDGAMGTFFFGTDLKLNEVKGKVKGKAETTLHLGYEASPKGLRLRSCGWTYEKCAYQGSVEYCVVDDYYVPKELKVTVTGGDSQGVSVFDQIKFDKYKIDW